jgi:replicative DNA helicase
VSIPHQTADRPSDVYDHPADAEYDQPPGRTAAFERVPAQDLDAEQSVLGGMLLSKDAIGDVVEVLKGHDFYRPAHETVFSAILDLYARGEPADPITTAAELAKRGELERVGGTPYLHTLVNAVPTAAMAQSYAEIVAELAVWRRLGEVGARIAQGAYRREGDAREAVDHAQGDLLRVMTDHGPADAPPLSDTAGALVDRIQARKGQGRRRGIETGFTDLDSLTGGLLPGQFVVIAARPAMGKTTVAIDVLRHCSVVNKIPAAFFSLEMGRDEIEERILAAHARVPHHRIKSGEVTEDDWARIARKMPDIEAAPLYIDDTASQSYMEIAAKARRLKQRHDIRLLVVDYLQLMSFGGRRPETRQQEVSEMSRNLKLLAKSLELPVIALSQLNRGPEQRADKKPMVSDLRESGAIEQDADMVILLHREDAYEKESPRAGEVDLIVAKHRNGPTATITVAAQLHLSRFVDMAQS